MYEFLTKKGQLLAFGFGIVVTVLFLLFINSGLDEFSSSPKEKQLEMSLFDFGLYASIIMVILGFAAWFIFSIIQTIDNPKGSLKGLLGVGALALIFLVVYLTAQPETSGPLLATHENFEVTDGQSKFISGSITTAGLLLGAAFLAFAAAEIRNIFK